MKLTALLLFLETRTIMTVIDLSYFLCFLYTLCYNYERITKSLLFNLTKNYNHLTKENTTGNSFPQVTF